MLVGRFVHGQATSAQAGFAERELLLNPKALPPASAALDPRAFQDPPAEFRSMPLWVWNDEMEWPRLAEQLAQFKQQGIGGVFVHPRPGLMTEYLGEEWFRLWKRSAEEGKRLGLFVNIYDENSYPSGFAGGHVPSVAPDTAAQFVQPDLEAGPGNIGPVRAGSLGAFAVTRDAGGGIVAARGTFELAGGVIQEDFEWGARVAAGLDRLVEDFALDGLTYYYRGLDGNEYERSGAGMILGNSLLTARGIAASGEGDLQTCLAMMAMDRIGAGGSYTEFYAMDFRENFLLMGHDGPGHIAISDAKPTLRSLGLYHGKRGYGVSVEFRVKLGPVTILGVTESAEGRLKMLAAEGESLPGPTLRVGNTNSRLRFALPPAEFVNRWCAEAPTHHCALGIGRQRGTLGKLAALLDIPFRAVL
jgi:hypothetical protein